MNPKSAATGLPPGLGNAFAFQVFNSSSWSLILGTPMLLFFKSMDASAAVLGATVAMLPLFSALQIPAASFVERAGYKQFVVRGWASRSIFILGIAIITLLPASVSTNLRIGLILLMLACFAATRGISVCGMMPWLTQLIPEPRRGSFVSRDMMCSQLALTGTMLLSSACVGAFPSNRTYACLFFFSYISALISVFFLRRIPDVPKVAASTSRGHPPWREMLLFRPFFRYVSYNVVFNFFVSCLSVLWVPFMKDGIHKSGSLILGLSAFSSIICALSAFTIGGLLDRCGSRPIMAVGSAGALLSQLCWLTIASGAVEPHLWILTLTIAIGSTGYTILGVAGTRLLMGLIPSMGRSHFFAISSVATSMTVGLMPIVWGFALDAATRTVGAGFPALLPGWRWTPYSLYYAIVIMGTLLAQFLRRQLDEPRSVSNEEFLRILLIESPARLASRALMPLRHLRTP
ncbi:MAG: MFS transporter, partial [Lentisphaerae bacterium]|nr:MFS transporter [Lentisphaerota bacterium]